MQNGATKAPVGKKSWRISLDWISEHTISTRTLTRLRFSVFSMASREEMLKTNEKNGAIKAIEIKSLAWIVLRAATTEQLIPHENLFLCWESAGTRLSPNLFITFRVFDFARRKFFFNLIYWCIYLALKHIEWFRDSQNTFWHICQ